MNGKTTRSRVILLAAARCSAIIAISLLVATVLNRDSYNDLYGKRLLQMHTTDLKGFAEQIRIKVSFYYAKGDWDGVQKVLDSNFGLFGYAVTDCRKATPVCPEQKLRFISSRSLPWLHFPDERKMISGAYTLLQRLPDANNGEIIPQPGSGEIIGRLYVIRNMPDSFADDYWHWLKDPLRKNGINYLLTSLVFITAGIIVWVLTELYFYLRRKQKEILLSRELELKQSVNRQLRMLAEKDAQITQLKRETNQHYEHYLEKIRELEAKMKGEEESLLLAGQIIDQLELDKAREAAEHAASLETVQQEMERLQEQIASFEESARKNRKTSFKVLEEAVRTPQFSNVFEQQVFKSIAGSPQYLQGEWRMLSNYDVAPGRNYRQFTDFLLFNRDALIIIEAKYYVGLIDSPGDFLNDIWVSVSSQQRRIDCLWGENPYHQINEYSMSLMKILKQRSPWMFQVYGIIVFPDEADIAKVGAHLGKFYRVTTIGKLLPLVESIFAEAARFQAAKNPKRPTPEQVESILRGRKIA